MVEHPLPGGFVNHVVRVGDTVRRSRAGETVRRSSGDRAEFVHRLLQHFERHGWPGAPRLLGVDERGREVLTFVEGHVAWRSPTDRVSSTESLAGVARLVRQFHDLTAGAPLAGDGEVVCHNDLSPSNTVYRGGGEGPLLPVAFIDWDIAARRASTTWRTCAGSTSTWARR